MKITCGHRDITVTNPSRTLFFKANITKAEYVEYYARIAELVVPYTKARLLSMYRFPSGVKRTAKQKDGFFQKDAHGLFPDWIPHTPIKKADGGVVNYVSINNAAALVYMANLVCVPHLSLSKTSKLMYPDRMIFDLDPAGKATFGQVKFVARKLRILLQDELELPTFVMTTGSRGLHLVIPLKAVHTFDFVRSFAHDVAHTIVTRHPQYATLSMLKRKRGNKIFIDYLRNGFGATAIAPYAVRALPNAPIATPLAWKELNKLKAAQQYHIKNIFRRLARIQNPWRDMSLSQVSLKSVSKQLSNLLSKEV